MVCNIQQKKHRLNTFISFKTVFGQNFALFQKSIFASDETEKLLRLIYPLWGRFTRDMN